MGMVCFTLTILLARMLWYTRQQIAYADHWQQWVCYQIKIAYGGIFENSAYVGLHCE